MKKIGLLILILAITTFHACYKPGDIRIKNDLDNVRIMDVKWGEISVATELLPGETSSWLTIEKYEEKLPSKHKVSFKMNANNKTIYLETEKKFELEEDEDLLIVIGPDTKVINPNK